MDKTLVILDREPLLEQLLNFMALAYASRLEPQPSGVGATRSSRIPRVLRDSPRNPEGLESVWMHGREAEAYNDLRHFFGSLRETEWLRTEELDERLWTLACEIALDPEAFADEAQRHARADVCMRDMLRPRRPYEVIFTVEHVKPPASDVTIWDARLTVGTTDLLAPFVARIAEEAQESFRRPFLGKPVLVVEVEGTAAAPVIQRARALAHQRLHLLRSSLAGHWQTHRNQLRFALGAHAFARALSGAPEEQQAWARPPALPIELELHAGHADRLRQLSDVHEALRLADPSLRPMVERACEWIGRGLCREWPGDALRDYTTAIEVLLIAAGQKGQKSVLVPYRMLALADLHGEAMTHPAAVRHAYDRRSVVAHEGDAAAGDEETTRQMLGAATECLGWLTRWAADHPRDNHAALVDALDTDALREKATVWLRRFPDAWSVQLVRGMASMPRVGPKVSR